ETIGVQGQRQSLRTFVNLNIADIMVQTTQVRPVEVNIEIGEQRRSYTVTQVPIAVEDPAVTFSPQRIAVQVLVPLSVKKTLTAAVFTAPVTTRDLQEAVEGRVKPQVRALAGFGPGLVIKEIIPPMVALHRGKK